MPSSHELLIVKTETNADGRQWQKWVKIGVAFGHRDGMGVSLHFDVIPSIEDLREGHLVVRARRDNYSEYSRTRWKPKDNEEEARRRAHAEQRPETD